MCNLTLDVRDLSFIGFVNMGKKQIMITLWLVYLGCSLFFAGEISVIVHLIFVIIMICTVCLGLCCRLVVCLQSCFSFLLISVTIFQAHFSLF